MLLCFWDWCLYINSYSNVKYKNLASFFQLLKLIFFLDCRYGFLVANIFLYSSVLAPIFWHLWIYAGSGNANFFYAITLVYNLGQALLIVDLIYAILRREYDIAHPENIGKVVIHK